jgi:hypothetical protein
MGFYGSTQTNRMIRAPEQKACDRGFPLLLLINPKGSLSCIIVHTTIDSSKQRPALQSHRKITMNYYYNELQL